MPAQSNIPVRLGPFALRFAIGALWAYVCFALLYQQSVAGVQLGALSALLSLVVGWWLLSRAMRSRAGRALSAVRALEIGLGGTAALLALVTMDLANAAVRNRARARNDVILSAERVRSDRRPWHGELVPSPYHPSDKGFRLFKPNVRMSGETYGMLYHVGMLASPILVDSVLELRRLSYAIGPHGLRELESLAKSRIFALGDSFVMGWATDEGKVWTDFLGAALGEPVYNLGINDTGPGLQLELFEYMLASHADSMRVGHLLWMIFEANDLEDPFTVAREPKTARVGLKTLLDGTILDLLLGLPGRLRRHSVIGQLLAGELTFADPSRGRAEHNELDGVDLSRSPIYYSQRFGYHLFIHSGIDRVLKPREYVLQHPNRVRLERTFKTMQDLSRRHGFEVTVILAPSVERLYGPAFEDFPPLAEPHFANYVIDLAKGLGFRTIDLLRFMEPIAATEMLYYRDDPHWNERGNEVAAQLIARALRDGDNGQGRSARLPALGHDWSRP